MLRRRLTLLEEENGPCTPDRQAATCMSCRQAINGCIVVPAIEFGGWFLSPGARRGYGLEVGYKF